MGKGISQRNPCSSCFTDVTVSSYVLRQKLARTQAISAGLNVGAFVPLQSGLRGCGKISIRLIFERRICRPRSVSGRSMSAGTHGFDPGGESTDASANRGDH